MNTPEIETASVKVMRSYDYCHFEICLGVTPAMQPAFSIEQVDELRKAAMRLADKAVSQYKIAKTAASRIFMERRTRDAEVGRMERIREKEETQRTVGEQAELKAFDDSRWEASHDYDYEDDWDRDKEEGY